MKMDKVDAIEILNEIARYDAQSGTIVEVEPDEWEMVRVSAAGFGTMRYRLFGTAAEVAANLIRGERERTANEAVFDWDAERTDEILRALSAGIR